MSWANLMDGRAIAEQIHAETSQRIAALKQRGVQPNLAFVRLGEDPASQVYVAMKERMSARLGIASVTQVLPEATLETELLKRLAQLNAAPTIHGVLVQAPLPPHINPAAVYAAVSPQKDVDGFHPINVGKLHLEQVDLLAQHEREQQIERPREDLEVELEARDAHRRSLGARPLAQLTGGVPTASP